MTTGILVAALSLFTIVSVAVWAYISSKRTQERLEDDSAPKSHLAKDGPGPNPVTAD